ncbi:PREDICTED: probable beta-D-xylosidase 6 [Branchiostoma belcheri]|uniref:Probable beta-D-xylosidase 6 n=1 Tax=Branchiostoma belcheri TaxID=7741 RepID=A0A6P4XFT4_BRABE|nr:PREDICTED: probable beta-D-xylosidase 6 [Branchiostoma belcheri]
MTTSAKFLPVINVWVIFLVCSIPFSVSQASFPFRNTSLPWQDRVDDLVGRLTMEEVIVQMSRGGAHENGPAPAIPRLGIPPHQWNTECLRGDPEAGPATAFPQALGLAATFSTEVIHAVAEATSREVRAKYNNYTQHQEYGDHTGISCFSPVINIMRHPLWGRNQETYGEDPYLSGSLAQSFVQGLQGDHPRYIRTNAGCKHFDVHGGPENIPSSRFSFDAKVSERDWHMTFLPQFQKCVEAGTYSIMCSYNSIRGVPACANKELLTDILRDSWGFHGYVVSDEGAVENIMLKHHYTKTFEETAAAAVNAGTNLDLTVSKLTNAYDHISKAVTSGLISNQTLTERVKPLFYTRMRLGEFDPPQMNPYSKLSVTDVVQSAEHRELAVEVALKTFVLLKNNDSVLPLAGKVTTLAVVGPFADNLGALYGDYAPIPDPKFSSTPLQGLSCLAGKTQHGAGCKGSDPVCEDYDQQDVKMAVEGADLVVVCLGTGAAIESEGRDRADLSLPGKQLQLLKDAVSYASSKPVVLLLFNAGPLDISWAKDNDAVKAIVECFLPAQATGEALRRMFLNENNANPAGRLPFTWPASMDQVPAMEDYTMDGRTYRYSTWDPLYPFGFGLSYAQFMYDYLHDHVLPTTIQPCDNVTAVVRVTNIGNVTGDEVVQFYLEWGSSSLPVPIRQLINFTRVTLLPNQQRFINVTITPREMAVYTDQWVVPAVGMTVFAGGQQPLQNTAIVSNVAYGTFTITGKDTPLKNCGHVGP